MISLPLPQASSQGQKVSKNRVVPPQQGTKLSSGNMRGARSFNSWRPEVRSGRDLWAGKISCLTPGLSSTTSKITLIEIYTEVEISRNIVEQDIHVCSCLVDLHKPRCYFSSHYCIHASHVPFGPLNAKSCFSQANIFLSHKDCICYTPRPRVIDN